MNLFEMVIKSTKVLLKPKNLLSTYNQTKIRYHIVTEPSYKEMQFEGNDSVIRHGVVTAQTPKVVTPDFLYRTSGFGDDAKEYIKELTKMMGKSEPALLYTYKNESTDMEIVAGNPMEVSERIKKRLVNNNSNHTVIRGVNALWDVSLLKFIFDYTRESSTNNFDDLSKSGLLEDQNGVPVAVRKRIQGLINEAKKGNVRAKDLHKELDEWGLFKEYEDEFLSLFRKLI
ncbi:MAG: hypothetical protein CL775_06320 [Chloroflexi bacterium]|uniref:Uncharacterized protein n=1 Tax=marine metagenome TaxID=408172 RepID=A0A382CLN9_9ZZZZ|nr:hypothetical protein [Chloroflexota bacterium]|tara:strand:- start:11298 stop:11984 length:687 start_codon:yes stop_codon:yes gene_type:complete